MNTNNTKKESSEGKNTRQEFEWDITDDGYFIVKLLEYVALNLDDRGIMRVLREVDNNDLAAALKGMSLEAQDIFLNNLSKRMAAMIREDMEFMGPVSTTECAKSASLIMVKIVRLMNWGEIDDTDSHIVQIMTELFRVDEERLSDNEAVSAEFALEKLFRQYQEIHKRIIV